MHKKGTTLLCCVLIKKIFDFFYRALKSKHFIMLLPRAKLRFLLEQPDVFFPVGNLHAWWWRPKYFLKVIRNVFFRFFRFIWIPMLLLYDYHIFLVLSVHGSTLVFDAYRQLTLAVRIWHLLTGLNIKINRKKLGSVCCKITRILWAEMAK